MYNFSFKAFTFLSLIIFSSCQSDQAQEVNYEPMELDFELVKSLEYDYLGRAFVMDYSNELNIIALYDDQRDEIIIANEDEILVQKKLSGDSKNSYGSRFSGALFWKDKLIILGFGAYHIYDLDLNLIEKVNLPYPSATGLIGWFTYSLIVDDWLIYYADTNEERATLEPPADPVVIWNLNKKTLHKSINTPAGIPMVWNAGGTGMATAQFAFANENLLVLYPNHPVIYEVNIQNGTFEDSIVIDAPTWNMPDIIKQNVENVIETIFDNLTYPSFTFLFANEELIITAFQHGVPREEVDKLPRNMLGGPKWFELENEYRKPKLYTFLGNQNVAETEINRGIQTWRGGYKTTNWPLGKEFKDEEEDFIRFYLYKPVLRPKSEMNVDSAEVKREEND